MALFHWEFCFDTGERCFSHFHAKMVVPPCQNGDGTAKLGLMADQEEGVRVLSVDETEKFAHRGTGGQGVGCDDGGQVQRVTNNFSRFPRTHEGAGEDDLEFVSVRSEKSPNGLDLPPACLAQRPLGVVKMRGFNSISVSEKQEWHIGDLSLDPGTWNQASTLKP
ncbi:MAG: hypothetical protein HBSIN02_20580 [Bacteroidia bacterium]|nr:MAG: hypothetical protein HBSIN02_20580 [Bacteroidia bacterium]